MLTDVQFQRRCDCRFGDSHQLLMITLFNMDWRSRATKPDTKVRRFPPSCRT